MSEENKNKQVQLLLPHRLVVEIIYMFNAVGSDASEQWQELMTTLEKQKENFTDHTIMDLFHEMRNALNEPANFNLYNSQFAKSYDLANAVDKVLKHIKNLDAEEWYCVSVTDVEGESNPNQIPNRIYDIDEAMEEFEKSMITFDSDSTIREVFLEQWSIIDGLPMAGNMIRGHYYDRKAHPNGLQSWKETYYQLASQYDQNHYAISNQEDTTGLGSVEVGNIFETLATEFEVLHKDTEWDVDGDWYEELDKFMSSKNVKEN